MPRFRLEDTAALVFSRQLRCVPYQAFRNTLLRLSSTRLHPGQVSPVCRDSRDRRWVPAVPLSFFLPRTSRLSLLLCTSYFKFLTAVCIYVHTCRLRTFLPQADTDSGTKAFPKHCLFREASVLSIYTPLPRYPLFLPRNWAQLRVPSRLPLFPIQKTMLPPHLCILRFHRCREGSVLRAWAFKPTVSGTGLGKFQIHNPWRVDRFI